MTPNGFEPDWFLGSSVPESLTGPPTDAADSVGQLSIDDEELDNAWSDGNDESDNSDGEDLQC